MPDSNWEQTLGTFKREITSITGRTRVLSIRFMEVRKQVESLKVALLMYCLERRRRHLARTRGFTSIVRDRKGLGKSLAMGAAGLIVSRMISGDKLVAIKGGLESLDAALQAQGKTAWAVSLGKNIRVLPTDDVIVTKPGEILVTWESLLSALAYLEREASQGVEMGNLNSVVSRLKGRKELIYLGVVVVKSIRVKAKQQ